MPPEECLNSCRHRADETSENQTQSLILLEVELHCKRIHNITRSTMSVRFLTIKRGTQRIVLWHLGRLLLIWVLRTPKPHQTSLASKSNPMTQPNRLYNNPAEAVTFQGNIHPPLYHLTTTSHCFQTYNYTQIPQTPGSWIKIWPKSIYYSHQKKKKVVRFCRFLSAEP